MERLQRIKNQITTGAEKRNHIMSVWKKIGHGRWVAYCKHCDGRVELFTNVKSKTGIWQPETVINRECMVSYPEPDELHENDDDGVQIQLPTFTQVGSDLIPNDPDSDHEGTG